MSTYVGIDYSHGKANRDVTTGLHYGCISTNSLDGWVMGEAEPIYPPTVQLSCPECNHTWDTDNLCPDDRRDCPECEHEFRPDGLDELEPIGWDLRHSEYRTDHSVSLHCVFVLSSPYYTYGRFCSPCAPGAIDLDNPIVELEDMDRTDLPRAYCFGHEMFEGDKAPYRVFRVDSNIEVLPER